MLKKGLICLLPILTAFLSCPLPIRALAEEETLDLEPIVIKKERASNSVYAAGLRELAYLSGSTLVESMRLLPLDLQSRNLHAGIQTDFALRGSDYEGVLLTLNGQRINDPQTGHFNSDLPFTLEDIERLEIIPLPGEGRMGPVEAGAGINIALKKPGLKKYVCEISGGSFQAQSSRFSLSDKLNGLGMRLSLEQALSRGYREDTDFRVFTSSFSSLVEIPDGEGNLNFGYQKKDFGAYDFYTPGKGYLSREETRTYLLQSGFSIDKESVVIKPNFLWRRHYDKFALDKTQLRSSYLNHHRTDLYTPSIYLQRETAFLGRLGLGLEYGQENLNSTGLGKHSRNQKSIFFDLNKGLGLKIISGLSARLDDFSACGRIITGSANLRYGLSERHALLAGITRSMRRPTFTELYYSDPTSEGNTGLSEEKSFTYQLGYDYKNNGTSTGIIFFLRKERDRIDWVKNSPAESKWLAENISGRQAFGIENYFRHRFNPRLELNSYYTYIDKPGGGKGYLYKYGPNYSRHIANTLFIFNLGCGIQTLELQYKKKPGRRGWLLFNSRLSRKINQRAEFFIKAANILNVEYQEIEGIPQPGRWLEAGLRFQW